MDPPLSKEDLKKKEDESPKKKQGSFLFERSLEKRMFFGNYKPRCLTIEKVERQLIMAYRYMPSKKVKNEFELNLNDYAAVLKNNEFEVVTNDKHYIFRVGKSENPEKVVNEINAVIRNSYALE